MVIDGRHAFLGGINISNDNFGRTSRKDRYIHDLHCRVTGPVVGELQFSFLRDWYFITGASPDQLIKKEFFPPLRKVGDSIARVVSSGPGQNYESTDKVYMTAVTTAKRYVWIITPYFVPDKPFCKLLCAAVARGVEIRIIVPRKNNHWYVQLATQSLYPVLLEAGVRIFEKKGHFSHAKALLIDGDWAKMGSSNCDVRSFKLNYELDFIVGKGSFLDDLHNQFKKEFADSAEVFLQDVSNKGIPRQLAENFCALFTPVL
jgi:cardiolipin synthase